MFRTLLEAFFNEDEFAPSLEIPMESSWTWDYEDALVETASMWDRMRHFTLSGIHSMEGSDHHKLQGSVCTSESAKPSVLTCHKPWVEELQDETLARADGLPLMKHAQRDYENQPSVSTSTQEPQTFNDSKPVQHQLQALSRWWNVLNKHISKEKLPDSVDTIASQLHAALMPTQGLLIDDLSPEQKHNITTQLQHALTCIQASESISAKDRLSLQDGSATTTPWIDSALITMTVQGAVVYMHITLFFMAFLLRLWKVPFSPVGFAPTSTLSSAQDYLTAALNKTTLLLNTNSLLRRAPSSSNASDTLLETRIVTAVKLLVVSIIRSSLPAQVYLLGQMCIAFVLHVERMLSVCHLVSRTTMYCTSLAVHYVRVNELHLWLARTSFALLELLLAGFDAYSRN